MPLSLAITALIATTIRNATNTKLEAPKAEPAAKPFTSFHHAFWSAIFVASLLAAAMRPAEYAHTLARPCLLAATVEGLLIGSALPKGIQTVLHPLVVCTAVANLATFVFSKAVGWTYKYGLSEYITKVSFDSMISRHAHSRRPFLRLFVGRDLPVSPACNWGL